jgi:hypothetical protein
LVVRPLYSRVPYIRRISGTPPIFLLRPLYCSYSSRPLYFSPNATLVGHGRLESLSGRWRAQRERSSLRPNRSSNAPHN